MTHQLQKKTIDDIVQIENYYECRIRFITGSIIEDEITKEYKEKIDKLESLLTRAHGLLDSIHGYSYSLSNDIK